MITEEVLQERVDLRRESAGPEIFRFFGPDHTIPQLTQRSWDLLVMMDAATKQPNERVSEIRKLVSNVQWRVVIGLPLIVFQSKGRRWASPSERAALNLCRTLGDNIIPTKRILEWTGDHISCTKNWLKRTSVRNLLQAMDLWKRFTDGANGLSGLDKAMCTVEGRDPTVVVARGLECANHISCLLLDYARLATEEGGVHRLVDLSNFGLYTVAVFTKRYGSWNFGIEDCVLLAFDFNRMARVPFTGKKLYKRISSKEQPQQKLDSQIGAKSVRLQDGRRPDRVVYCWTDSRECIGHHLLFKSRPTRDGLASRRENENKARPFRLHVRWTLPRRLESKVGQLNQADADGRVRQCC